MINEKILKNDFDKLRDFFLQHLQVEKNLAKNTIEAYSQDFIKFKEFLQEKKIPLQKIDNEYITSFILFLKKKNLSSATIVRILSTVRNFYNFLIGHNLIKNPHFFIESPKIERSLPEVLTQEEVSATIDSAISKKVKMRDIAIIELLYGAGLRISEISEIKIENIIFENSTLKIKGKGKKERIAFLNKNSIEAIKRYLPERSLKKNAGVSSYLFINNRGKKISRQSLWKIIKKLNITEKNVTPHTFRHSFATHLLEEGLDLRIVQELLGHKTLATTEIYTHINKKQIKKIYKKFHPRS